ncbi:MAG: histidine phosphatase family protein [Gemmataceae bacterium]
MIWLVRHGQSEANIGLVNHDFPNIVLTPLGHAQANALARWCPLPPDWLAHSPFLRARQTAEPMRQRFPTVPVHELAVQEFTYLNSDQVGLLRPEQREPVSRAYWERLDPYHREGGPAESFADFCQRVEDFLRWAERQTSFGIVFSHAEFIRAVLLRLMYPHERDLALFMRRYALLRLGWYIPNGCVVRLRPERERGCWWFSGIEITHLNDVAAEA